LNLPLMLYLLPVFIAAISSLYIIVSYFRRNLDIRFLKIVITSLIATKIIVAIGFTYAQFSVWNSSPFTRLLLTTPLELKITGLIANLSRLLSLEHSYFIYYALNRFWVNELFVISLALIAYFGVSRLVVKKRDGLSYKSLLILVSAILIVGWPSLIVLITSSLVIGVLISILKFIRKDPNMEVSLDEMLIFGLIFTLFFGYWVAKLLNLQLYKL